jgi:hypothetical protein
VRINPNGELSLSTSVRPPPEDGVSLGPEGLSAGDPDGSTVGDDVPVAPVSLPSSLQATSARRTTEETMNDLRMVMVVTSRD